MRRIIVPLGTAGWMPSTSRHTMCFAYETPSELILFDLGTGVSRFSSEIGQELVRRHQRIIIFLSHYHLDHIAGLLYLPRFFIDKDVTIAGPGLGIYEQSVEQILNQLCSQPFSALPLAKYPMHFKFQDLSVGWSDVGGLEIIVQLQDHPDPSLGFRVMDVAYITDTRCSLESVHLSRGCNVLIHEAMLDAQEYAESALREISGKDRVAHSDAINVAKLAREAEVKTLLLAHLNPSYSDDRLNTMLAEARQFFSATNLAQDLIPIEIQAS